MNFFKVGHEVPQIRFLPRLQREGDRPAKAITDQMDFGRDAATTPAQRLV